MKILNVCIYLKCGILEIAELNECYRSYRSLQILVNPASELATGCQGATNRTFRFYCCNFTLGSTGSMVCIW